MSYLAIVIGLGLLGMLCWTGFYFYFKKNPEKFQGLNAVVAFVALGPLFPLFQSSLARRNYAVTNRELWGLVVLIALFFAAIAISLIFGVGIRGA